ncbi:hypothetical protein PYCC9005_002715 [Savitreella phatthalungensis]
MKAQAVILCFALGVSAVSIGLPSSATTQGLSGQVLGRRDALPQQPQQQQQRRGRARQGAQRGRQRNRQGGQQGQQQRAAGGVPPGQAFTPGGGMVPLPAAAADGAAAETTTIRPADAPRPASNPRAAARPSNTAARPRVSDADMAAARAAAASAPTPPPPETAPAAVSAAAAQIPAGQPAAASSSLQAVEPLEMTEARNKAPVSGNAVPAPSTPPAAQTEFQPTQPSGAAAPAEGLVAPEPTV